MVTETLLFAGWVSVTLLPAVAVLTMVAGLAGGYAEDALELRRPDLSGEAIEVAQRTADVRSLTLFTPEGRVLVHWGAGTPLPESSVPLTPLARFEPLA